MKVKATILCENSVFHIPGAIAEHGLSIYIETDYGNYLFDTGQGRAILNNAFVLQKDLTIIKAIILSHHHFDHTGGLLPVLDVKGAVDVITHPQLFKESYRISKGKQSYTGILYNRLALENKGANFLFNTNWYEIAPGIYLSGEVPRETDFEIGDENLVIKEEFGFSKDQLWDDQSLIITTEKGLLIVLGCSHSGIINILNYAIKKTGCDKIYAVIGGTHLGPVSDEQREATIKALKEYSIEKIGVSHCTGLKGSLRLAQEFKEKFFFCNVGTVVEIL